MKYIYIHSTTHKIYPHTFNYGSFVYKQVIRKDETAANNVTIETAGFASSYYMEPGNGPNTNYDGSIIVTSTDIGNNLLPYEKHYENKPPLLFLF